MDPSPDPLTTPPTAAPGTTGRKFLWSIIAALAVAPVVWLPTAIAVAFLTDLYRSAWASDLRMILLLPLPFVIAAVLVVVRTGLIRGWPDRTGLLWKWGIAATAMTALSTLTIATGIRVEHTSQEKAVLGNLRQLSAAIDQFFLENGYRLFVNYDDVVGPTRYVKIVNPVVDEDYRTIFPVRRYLPGKLVARLPGGRSVAYDNDPDNAPPVPRDGVRVFRESDGRRVEVTYRDGVPHGPFRAYWRDGRLWGEGTYAQGRVTGPSWNYSPRGSRFNEVTTPSQDPAEVGARKLAARDYAGAIAACTLALEFNPIGEHHRDRAAARAALGDREGAIADYVRARELLTLDFERRPIDEALARLRPPRSPRRP